MSSAPGPAGWYRDPDDPKRHRFWDGRQWTRSFPPADEEQDEAPGER
ncbi:MAG: DUF2510 domain-containing protein [Marmoricola sp.]|nr:DUF2510 domain-containing protein [Marmoricola sp.]